MRRTLIKIIKFLDKDLPWWLCCILGLLLMIVPSAHALIKGITSMEPGFSYGILYGVGICYSTHGFLSSFHQKKKAASDQEIQE